MKIVILLALAGSLFLFNHPKEKADLLVLNATIYTVDAGFSVKQAMAVKDGRILATGTSQEISEKYSADETLDASGKFIYPGFIDAHAHFVSYGESLRSANLTGTKSWDECVERLRAFVKGKNIEEGKWITGRGWDQNDWDKKEFPTKEALDKLFPNNPVILSRVDGHAAIVNSAAIALSGIKPGDKIEGGEMETRNGALTGILVDNAVDLVTIKMPLPSKEEVSASLMEGQQNCFAAGLTTIDDCGLDYRTILLLDELQKKNQLKMRMYAMLSDIPENYDFIFKNGKIKTDRLNVRAFKVYADGALGSRGACLLQPYSDKPGHYGFLLSSKKHFDSVANILSQKDFQMCTHAIGDSGNRVILNTYAKYLKGKNDKRWRIEHAQVVNKRDFQLFAAFNIIPSVQPTHATSDMYWAEARLGSERVKNAYAYRTLLQQNGWLPLGTDFPVEDIDPLKTFFAAVFRKDASGWPEGGYQMENALSREQTIRGMTIWAAKSNFEEQEKGSLEKGKFADFVLLDEDLMKATPEKVQQTKVLKTYVNGEKVFQNK
jgi:predicted amidohydrolase YtcJ